MAAPVSPSAGRRQSVYQPEADVEQIADFFNKKYGNLGSALKHFDPDHEFDLETFEIALKKWGIKVGNVIELFDHIDEDWSGRISLSELFLVLESPLQDIQDRERNRQADEVRRTYEELAKCIAERFGSIEEAVTKYGLQGSGPTESSTLSVAKFRQLVNKLGMELDAKQLQVVFDHIDEDRTGTVSIQELQIALSDNLTRVSLVQLATTLIEEYGSIDEAFHSEFEFQRHQPQMPLSLPGVGRGNVASVASDMSLGHVRTEAGPISEDKFLRLLRGFSGDPVHLSTARLMHAFMSPFTIEEFAARLKREHAKVQDEKQQKKNLREQREREQRKNMQQQAMPFAGRERAEEDVKRWADEMKKDHVVRRTALDDIAHGWSSAARAGRSNMQLKDYISALQNCIDENKVASDELRDQLEDEACEIEGGLREYLGPTPSHYSSPLGEATPSVVGTPYWSSPSVRKSPKTPHLERLDGLQRPKAEKAERLIQAAASGDMVAIQQGLSQRIDVNAVAWGGVTALMTAAHHGREAVMECLFSGSADLNRTDLRGRTAVDYAHRQPVVREWLKGRGGLSSRELAAEAEALARRVIQLENYRAKLEAKQQQLPSKEVLQKARLRQAQRRSSLPGDPTPSASFGRFGQGGSRSGLSSPQPSPAGLVAGSPGPSPSPQQKSALASGRPIVGRHVSLEGYLTTRQHGSQ